MDETPYVVPDLFTQMNNNVFRNNSNSSKLLGNSNHAALNNSFTQDDLRLHDSGISSQHSGESYYVNHQRVHETNHRPSSSINMYVITRHAWPKWPECHNLASYQMFLWIFDEFF